MDLQTATVSNSRLLKAARVAAFICFAVAGVLLVASLKAAGPDNNELTAKSVELTVKHASLTL